MSRGFSLTEVLVAAAVFVIGVAGLVPLFLLSARATADARATTYAAVLAQAKMEELRSLPWGDGRLAPSPPNALAENLTGYSDFVDVDGRSLGSGVTPPPAALFMRRWSIAPLHGSPDAMVIQLLVARLRTGPGAAVARPSDGARIVSVRTRTEE